jgi:predicted sulfurtransferase
MISNRSRLAIVCAVFAAIAFSNGSRAIQTRAATALPAQSDGAARIKPEEVAELLKKDKAVLVDVRGDAAYKSGHVKGALNIPYSDIRTRAGELPRNKMIVTYCS